VARRPRIQLAGGIYHVTARGNRRQRIFLDDRDSERFLQILPIVAARYEWRCHAYCLMPNHYHLLIGTVKPTISAGMQKLNGGYAQWFNHKHELDGHLFQGRFHAVLVESDWHLLELARYVVLNPVRAGLCAHAGEWRWSSFRAATAAVALTSFLDLDLVLARFGAEPSKAKAAFRAFVEDAARLPGPRGK